MLPLLAGLIVIPFISGLWLDPLTPIIGDIRQAKEFIALIFALLIGLGAIYRGIRPMRNKWLLFLIGFLVMSVWYIPPFKIYYGMWYGQESISGIWAYKPILYSIVYFLMFLGVMNLKLDLAKVFKSIMWVGIVLSGIVFIQNLRLDQLYVILPYEVIGQPTKPGLVATMGNPTLLAAFLVMCVPIALRLRNIYAALIMIIAIGLIQSQVAIAALIGSLLVYGFFKVSKGKVWVIPSAIIALGLIGFCASKYITIQDNGRFPVWKQVLTDIKTPPITYDKDIPNAELASKRIYPISGLGLGSYNYIFINKHKTPFKQAHNDWLEFLYSCGIVGAVLAVGTLVKIMVKPLHDENKLVLFSSLTAIFICAFGTFVFQIEPHRFYTIALLGMMANENCIV